MGLLSWLFGKPTHVAFCPRCGLTCSRYVHTVTNQGFVTERTWWACPVWMSGWKAEPKYYEHFAMCLKERHVGSIYDPTTGKVRAA